MERIGFQSGGFNAEDLLEFLSIQKVDHDRCTAVACGIIHVADPLDGNFIAGVWIAPDHAGIEHPLFDQLGVGLAVSVADFEESLVAAVENLATGGIPGLIHAVDGEHGEHTVGGKLAFGECPVVGCAGEAGVRAIAVAHHPDVGSFDFELFSGCRFLSHDGPKQQAERSQGSDGGFPSCGACHGWHTIREPNPIASSQCPHVGKQNAMSSTFRKGPW